MTSPNFIQPSVELIDWMGNDLAFVNAARVSFHRESDWEELDWGALESKDPKLFRYLMGSGSLSGRVRDRVAHLCGTLTADDKGIIRYMMENGHGSPFEHVVFKFRVRCTIAVAREWFRHRIASYNEESTRYVKMRPDFYVPPIEDVRVQVGKPGRYTFEQADVGLAGRYLFELECLYTNIWEFYDYWIGEGIAREVVRNALPLGFFTEFITTINFRSLTNFLHLRTAPTALKEIRDMANIVQNQVRPIIPYTMGAWETAGRPRI